MESIKSCRICSNKNLKEILDLGKQPFANSLLQHLDEKEEHYPLSISWCPGCNLVQLDETPEPEDLFSNYVWVTSTSKVAQEHAKNFYREILSRAVNLRDGYILEVASNDGTFLKPFADNNYKVIGVDPAENIAEIANANGVPTKCRFFGVSTAREITGEFGPARVVIARNVLPHVANLHDFVQGLHLCLHDDGLLAIEFHYARVIYEELHYDSIYHEHLCYFTLKSIEKLLQQYSFFITDIRESPISGGSLILFVKKKREKESSVVQYYRDSEEKLQVNEWKSWNSFAKRVHSHREQLLQILADITEKNGPIVGYGASARSSTLLNFCGIDTRFVRVIADQNALKHQHYTAGTRIPIASPEEVMKLNPEYVLILAWNFTSEISRILRDKFKFTGKCIVPLPFSPRIITAGC